eukprot:CAMPEP_0119011196 /NCGR_PEP_ID=MMETSP1176-20130426/5514_1 /TAXON_ID=265551 /ORGANISM="Synedropsis recta cf, Strain CCMP1620" /LENGTH=355 /DNA_ID=CAMNT_0006963985 /DNA_START=58 /DNA_END=1125 /DNA_ORIENTATION=-
MAMTTTALLILLLLVAILVQESLAFIPHSNSVRARSSFLAPAIQDMKSKTSAAVTDEDYGSDDKPAVDMNQYNLPLDQILEEWTANLMEKTFRRKAGVYLGAKSAKDIMVDPVQVMFQRKTDSGLGILLEEIAGGREDGLGITVVSGLVEDGAADGCGIQEGDSISAISVKRLKTSEATEEGLEEDDKYDAIVSVSTECLGYDATVDKILSLPAAEGEEEIFVLSMNRLRRRPRVEVTIQYPNKESGQKQKETTIELFSGENLRGGMLARGVDLNDPLARRFDNGGSGSCGAEGRCGTCAVSILQGGELLNPSSVQEQQMLKENPHWRLGCRAVIGYGNTEGNLILRIDPKQWAE